jgi:hypothetical protein
MDADPTVQDEQEDFEEKLKLQQKAAKYKEKVSLVLSVKPVLF